MEAWVAIRKGVSFLTTFVHFSQEKDRTLQVYLADVKP